MLGHALVLRLGSILEQSVGKRCESGTGSMKTPLMGRVIAVVEYPQFPPFSGDRFLHGVIHDGEATHHRDRPSKALQGLATPFQPFPDGFFRTAFAPFAAFAAPRSAAAHPFSSGATIAPSRS